MPSVHAHCCNQGAFPKNASGMIMACGHHQCQPSFNTSPRCVTCQLLVLVVKLMQVYEGAAEYSCPWPGGSGSMSPFLSNTFSS